MDSLNFNIKKGHFVLLIICVNYVVNLRTEPTHMEVKFENILLEWIQSIIGRAIVEVCTTHDSKLTNYESFPCKMPTAKTMSHA